MHPPASGIRCPLNEKSESKLRSAYLHKRDMSNLISMLGLVGFIGGVIAVVALFAQRDANKDREKAAEQKREGRDGGA